MFCCFLFFSLAFISETDFNEIHNFLLICRYIAWNKQYFICVKANVHGCRQFILYAIAEKVSAMPVWTHQHRGRRSEESNGALCFICSWKLSIARKGKEGHGKYRQVIDTKRQKFNSKYTRKKGMKYIWYRWKMSAYCFLFIDLHRCD